MEASHPRPTARKSFRVEISRARDGAELTTDGAARLRERLEGHNRRAGRDLGGGGEAMRRQGVSDDWREGQGDGGTRRWRTWDSANPTAKDQDPNAPIREKRVEADFDS